MINKNRTLVTGVVLFLVVAMFVPNVVSSFWLRSLTSAAAFSLAALGATFLFGRLRIAALSQVALVGIGGWTALRIAHGTGLPFVVVIVCAGIFTALASLCLAYPALRIRGLYLALVTMMLAGGMEKVFQATGFPDGGPGFLGRDTVGDRSAMRRPSFATTDASYFRFCIVVIAVGLIVVGLLQSGRIGRMWAAIGRGNGLADSLGINTTTVQTAAFVISGFFAGVGGGLLAGSVGFLDPSSFRSQESIIFFALVAAAGTTSLAGAIVAALLYRAVPTLFNDIGIDGDLANVIFGAALIHALVTGGGGLTGQISAVVEGRRAKRAVVPVPVEAVEVADA